LREKPENPVFGRESNTLATKHPPHVKARRSIAKAFSWRFVGTIDTLILSYLLITYLGPLFGLERSKADVLHTVSYIAMTEVVTKTALYFLHERFWVWLSWGTSVVDGERKETYALSTIKTATWRTLASLDTMMLAWLFTGNISISLSIGGLEVITKLILYFFHERIWSHIGFGIVHQPDLSPPDEVPTTE
jgi:uncharacterized membrane protein